MIPEGVKITTPVLIWGTIMFAAIDAVLVPLLAWRIRNETFARMKVPLLIVTGLFWFGMWMGMVTGFWEPVYRFVFPGWARWLIPPVYGLLFTGVCLLFFWLARKMGGRHSLNFILLGGLWGMCTHLMAVGLGIVSKPPPLQRASPVAAVVIAIFEFIFYWCIITLISSGLQFLKKNKPA
jgi:hypothetical protein